MLVVRKHTMGDIVQLTPENTVLMSYYRNNCLHGVILPALLACCFVNSRKLGSSRPGRLLKILYPFLRDELQLEWDEKSFAENLSIYINQLIELGLLKKVGNSLQRPDRSDQQYLPLIRLAQIVQPILERYCMTFVVLWQSSSHPLTESEVEQQCHLLAQKISMGYGINSPDFFDRALFLHFLKTMQKKNYLTINKKFEFTDFFDHISLDLRNLLSVEVRSSILSLTRDNLPVSPVGKH
ncbi:MAG: glycerol-3-phosphate O-acyltransferase [Gammaproteobacteria bacterium]|jgi:glycerol-3-phosphate O-acyltransferase